jgi:hypothetical protein
VRVLFFLCAILHAQGGAPVEGTVASRITHAGLSGAGVSIVSTTGRRITYTTTTDPDGSFRFSAIDQDGEFTAIVSKTGYLPFTVAAFRLGAATGAVRLNVELSPLPALRGRVTDPDGHPVPEARVDLVGVSGNWSVTTKSGKDGAFVYQGSLPSPAFVLRALPPKDLPPPQSTKEHPLVWAPTYYPDGAERSQAVRIVWHRDADLEGYGIKLRAVPVFHVRGTVFDDAGAPVAGAAVKLLQAALPVMLALAAPDAQATTRPDGTFDLPGVRSGDWALAAAWKRGAQPLSATLRGRVSDKDWENVRIKLEAPFTITGVMEFPEAPQPGRFLPIVSLRPAEGSESPDNVLAPSGPDGRFAISGVHPGRYQVVANSPDAGVYLDSIRMGGREILGQTVDLMDGSLPLRVIYKNNGGSLRGNAEHCSDVLVMPKDPVLQQSEFLVGAPCDRAGHFEIPGLRPGDYYAVAFTRGPDWMDSSLAIHIAASGTLVTVQAGQSTLATLKVTPLPE